MPDVATNTFLASSQQNLDNFLLSILSSVFSTIAKLQSIVDSG